MRIAAVTAVTSLMPGAQGSQRSRGDRCTLSCRERSTGQRSARMPRFSRPGNQPMGCREDLGHLRSNRSRLCSRGIFDRAARASGRACPGFAEFGAEADRGNAGAREHAAGSAEVVNFDSRARGANLRGVLSGQRYSQAALLCLSISPAGRSNLVGVCRPVVSPNAVPAPRQANPEKVHQTCNSGTTCPEFSSDASTGLRDVSRGGVLRGSDRPRRAA
jgi:hypothetical protein